MRLARDSHVVALQETRGSARDLSEFVDFLPGWSTYGSFTAKGNAGGVVFLLALAIVALHTSILTEVLVPGRIAVLRMRGPEAPPLDIYNLHLVPNGLHSVSSQLHLLSASFSPLRTAITIAIGDVNVCAPGEGRLDLHTGRLSIGNSSLVDLLGTPSSTSIRSLHRDTLESSCAEENRSFCRGSAGSSRIRRCSPVFRPVLCRSSRSDLAV